MLLTFGPMLNISSRMLSSVPYFFFFIHFIWLAILIQHFVRFCCVCSVCSISTPHFVIYVNVRLFEHRCMRLEAMSRKELGKSPRPWLERLGIESRIYFINIKHNEM